MIYWQLFSLIQWPFSFLSPLSLSLSFCLSVSLSLSLDSSDGIERWTEKSDAKQKQVRVPGSERDFSHSQISVQTLLRCSYSHQHLHARKTLQTLAAIPLFRRTNILHAMIGMGSAALAAAVPYPGKVTRIFWKELM